MKIVSSGAIHPRVKQHICGTIVAWYVSAVTNAGHKKVRTWTWLRALCGVLNHVLLDVDLQNAR